MIVYGQDGRAIGESELLERIRGMLGNPTKTLKSADPVEILAGVIAAFYGGFSLRLIDVETDWPGDPEHRVSSEIPSLPETSGEIREAL